MHKLITLVFVGLTFPICFAQMAFLSGPNNELSVLNLYSQQVVGTIPLPGECGTGVFNNDFSLYYLTGYATSEVILIDPAIQQIVGSIPVQNPPTEIVLNELETRAYVCNQTTNTVTVIDLQTNQTISIIPVGIYPSRLALQGDDQFLYVTNASVLIFPSFLRLQIRL